METILLSNLMKTMILIKLMETILWKIIWKRGSVGHLECKFFSTLHGSLWLGKDKGSIYYKHYYGNKLFEQSLLQKFTQRVAPKTETYYT